MPLAGGRQWRAQPFSYKKLCYEIGGWLYALFLVCFFVFNFAGAPGDWGLWFGGAALIAVIVLAAQRLGWKLLNEDFRARIPYDSSEAAKGTIHSYRDLWRWLRRRRDD